MYKKKELKIVIKKIKVIKIKKNLEEVKQSGGYNHRDILIDTLCNNFDENEAYSSNL